MTKPTREELIELFRRTSDCLAQTIDDSRVPAMTGDRFVEVITKLLNGRVEDIKPTVWLAGASADRSIDLSDLTVSVVDLETGEEVLKHPSSESLESWASPVKQSYRIVWRSLITGVQGHGEPMTLDDAMSALKAVDPKWTGIISHWIEPVPHDDDREVKS